MKKKLTETEKANIELNNAFYGRENDNPEIDSSFVNNNNISLVLNSSKDNDKDNEDM